MKKLLIVLLATGMVSAVSAQPGYQKNHNEVAYGHNDNRSSNNGFNDNRKERDQQIERINRDFDQQIRMIRADRYMRPAVNNRKINLLEKQRDQQCSKVIARFSNNRYGNYNDDYVRNNKRF